MYDAYDVLRNNIGLLNEAKKNKHKYVHSDNPYISHEAAEESSLSLGVGLGKAYDDGTKLYNIGINQYKDSDASFINDGDDPATYRTNIPAIIAARMAGGTPDPKVVNNGINRRSTAAPFKLRPLRDDLGPNG